jgi:predicted DsbA family dithiol-disulfide isomerase
MTDLYLDFLCPYAWRGVELAAVLRAEGEPFRLRHYSLVEGNHPDNASARTWQITAQAAPAGGEGGWQEQSLQAFLAAQAAALQGEEARWAFTLALLRARHEARQDLTEPAFAQAAQDAGLDLERWAQDRADDMARRADLRAELDAAAEIGVFGTPTFVLPDGAAAYYRFEHLTRDPAVARERWSLYRTVLGSEAGIGTIKRAKHRPAK